MAALIADFVRHFAPYPRPESLDRARLRTTPMTPDYPVKRKELYHSGWSLTTPTTGVDPFKQTWCGRPTITR